MAFYRYGANAPEPKNDLMQYIFPDGEGFQPVEHGDSRDKSFVVGLRGDTDSGWTWDVGAKMEAEDPGRTDYPFSGAMLMTADR